MEIRGGSEVGFVFVAVLSLFIKISAMGMLPSHARHVCGSQWFGF